MRKSNKNNLFYNAPNAREFFGHIQRFLEVGFWYWDSKSNHIHFSKKTLIAMGIKSDDQGIVLDDFFGAIHPDDQKILKKAFNRLLTDKSVSVDLDFRVLQKGIWRWARTKAAVAEHDSDGKVSIIIGKFFDIDVALYSAQSIATEKKKVSFSFFSFSIADNTFQWQNPKQSLFDFKTSGKVFSFFEELKPFVASSELNQLVQRWKLFVKSSDVNFIHGFYYAGSDKTNRRLKLIASKLVDDSETIDGIVLDITSILEDSSESKKVKYPSLLNLHQLVVLSFDSGNNVTFCNRFAEKTLGYKLSELNEDNTIKKVFSHPETFKRFIEFIKSGQSKPFECSVIAKDGTAKIISWSIIQGFENLEDITVIGKDVSYLRSVEHNYDTLTERIKIYSSLTNKLLSHPNSETIFLLIGEELEKIFPKKICLVFSFDSRDSFATIEGIFGISHRMWESFVNELGWNPVGRRFALKPEDIDKIKVRTPLKAALSFSELTSGYISLSAAKVIERTFGIDETYLNGLLFEDNFFGGIIVFNSISDENFDIQPLGDISLLASHAINKIKIEEGSNAELEELKTNNTRKLDLLSHVSHEIRTPLNAILGFSQLLANSDLNDNVKSQYISIINSKGKSLIRLINDLIDFNKIEKGELTIVRSDVNVNRLLNDIYKFYLNEIELFNRENIELKLSIPDETDFLELFTDEGRLVQVIENLIDNALKFTERGTVEFGYTIENEKVNIFVRDTGVGIDPKIQELIFEKYRQINTSQTQGTTGLGLKISKEIISLLKGGLSIISQQGIGTTVYVELPLKRITQEPISISEETLVLERRVDFKNKVILIVDDEEVNYLILNELLTAWGATTLWAKNGKEAVELVSSINQTIDLVLMDIRMPVMDGYAATMEIKQINPKIPIIAQTAYASEEDRLKAEAAGCNGYITKPIDTNVLSEVLEIFLIS